MWLSPFGGGARPDHMDLLGTRAIIDQRHQGGERAFDTDGGAGYMLSGIAIQIWKTQK